MIAERIRAFLENDHSWMQYDQLPARAKSALTRWLEEAGFDREGLEAHVRKYHYNLCALPADQIKAVLARWGWDWHGPGDADNERRVNEISQLRRGAEPWPYINGARSVQEWLSGDEDGWAHGDGWHRMQASLRQGRDVEFLTMSPRTGVASGPPPSSRAG